MLEARPIFVIGVGRSGTTLLRLMLHHHPRIAIPYESHFIPRYHAELASFGDLGDDANALRLITRILDEDIVKLWDHRFDAQRILARLRERSFSGIIDAVYVDYAAGHGKERWGDKSYYLDQLPIIHLLFPAAQYIHIIRDGRDVAASVLKLSWGPANLIAAAEWWNNHVWLGRRLGAILGGERYLEVRYEDLVEDPVGKLGQICKFLKEEYSPEMLDYHKAAKAAIPSEWQHQHHNVDAPPKTARAYAWKREMDPIDVALFGRYAGGMLAEVGYEVPAIHVNKIRYGIRVLSTLAKRSKNGSKAGKSPDPSSQARGG
jgi:hypothetical protein